MSEQGVIGELERLNRVLDAVLEVLTNFYLFAAGIDYLLLNDAGDRLLLNDEDKLIL